MRIDYKRDKRDVGNNLQSFQPAIEDEVRFWTKTIIGLGRREHIWNLQEAKLTRQVAWLLETNERESGWTRQCLAWVFTSVVRCIQEKI